MRLSHSYDVSAQLSDYQGIMEQRQETGFPFDGLEARSLAAATLTRRPLRILYVLSRLERDWFGGIGRVTTAMAAALAQRGHDVHIAGPQENPAGVGPVRGVTLHPWCRMGRKWRQIGPLLSTVNRLQPDIIHFHAALPHGETMGAALAHRALRRGPTIVCTPHTGTRWNRVDYRARFALTRADLVVVPSQWSRKSAAEIGVRPERLRVVWNGIDTPFQPASRGREPLVMALGRFVPTKGMDLLVDAFASISPSAPDWSLVIGGDGPQLGELRNRVGELSLPITLPGHLDTRKKTDLLRRAGIGVIPSREDMIPGAMLEMQAHGVPVLATPVGGVAEAALDGRAAYLASSAAPEALADGLKQLIASAPLRNELAKRGQEVSAGRSWALLAEQLEAVYLAGRAGLRRP